MRSPGRKVVQGVLSTLVLATLGFGASQVLASPAETAAAGGCTRSEAGECNAGCRETYGTGYAGSCSKDPWGGVSCDCFQLVFPLGG